MDADHNNFDRRQQDIDDINFSSQADPHSQEEIMKVYMKRLREAAPESFERLGETPNAFNFNNTASNVQNAVSTDQAALCAIKAVQDDRRLSITSDPQDYFPSSKSYVQLSSNDQSLPNQAVNSQRATLGPTVTGTSIAAVMQGGHRSTDLIAAHESMRSPWMSQQKSSVPKSSFCLSLSLSASSNQGSRMTHNFNKALLNQQVQRELSPTQERQENSQYLSEQGSDFNNRQINENQVDESLSLEDVDNRRQKQKDLLSSSGDNGSHISKVRIEILQHSQSHGSSGSQSKNDGIDQLQGDIQNSQYIRDNRDNCFDERSELSRISAAAQSKGRQIIVDEGMGSHLLAGSMGEKRNILDVIGKIEAVTQSEQHNTLNNRTDNTGDDDISDVVKNQLLSPMSVQNMSRNSSHIAQIRTMVEEQMKTQEQMRRTLKRMPTVQKPTSSPMLLASAASQSASSPASGGRAKFYVERLADRRQNRLESLESISQRQLLKALGSTSTVDILHRQNTNSAAMPSNLSEKPSTTTELMKDGSISHEDRFIFNNYKQTNKQLKFDNMSSCSLMLSKSGASSTLVAHKEKRKQRNPAGDMTQKFARDSNSMPLILKSFASQGCNNKSNNQQATNNKANTGGTALSLTTVNHKIQEIIKAPDIGSQVSGHGSLLHQFITEGVEEDTVDEEQIKIPIHGVVSVNRLISHENDESSGSEQLNDLVNKNFLSGSSSNEGAGTVRVAQIKNTVFTPTMMNKQLQENATTKNNRGEQSNSTLRTFENFSSDRRTLYQQQNSRNGSKNYVLTRNGGTSVKNSENIYIDNSNKGIELQLEAIRSCDISSHVPPIDCYGLFHGDDAIQRVVSQVRSFENESGENQQYKFEIERTDSLEFTRNSGTDSHVQGDLYSRNSCSERSQTRNRGRVLDHTQDEVHEFREQVIAGQNMLNPAA